MSVPEEERSAYQLFLDEMRMNAVLSQEYKDHLTGLVNGAIDWAKEYGKELACEDKRILARECEHRRWIPVRVCTKCGTMRRRKASKGKR